MTGIDGDKQVIRGTGLIGPRDSGAPTLVDLTEGRITRIRPLHYEMSYDKKKVTEEEMAGWRRDYPDAFEREYDSATGVSLSGWLRS